MYVNEKALFPGSITGAHATPTPVYARTCEQGDPGVHSEYATLRPNPIQTVRCRMPATPASRPYLLIVDDDPLILSTLSHLLARYFAILPASSRAAARELHVQHRPALALIDLGLPPLPHRADEGLALISEILACDPLCKIIVLSGQDEEAHARHARTLGALEFIPKPAQVEHLLAVLRRALALHQEESAERLRPAALKRLIGTSPLLEAVRSQLQAYADTPFALLIEGESGTGKEVAARAAHEASQRHDQPFLALNCAAISPGLIEASLFGHARGAYTGAVGAQAGYFEDAGDGTLFLDEIGELPLELQPKLLRVLESGEYQRLGETRSRQTRARVIAATNRDLGFDARSGRFRPDLYHRLSVLRVTMPPLRSLGQDKHLLREHFIADYAQRLQLPPCQLEAAAQQRWLAYDFPGNVRELRNIVARLLSRFAGQQVSLAALEAELEADPAPQAGASPAPQLSPPELEQAIVLDEVLRRVERDYISAALRRAHGNMSQAARLLGLSRSTLYNRIDILARHGETLAAELSPLQRQE